ncbi:hypothetical protein AB0I30_27865 [Nocardia tengchongensis]|uniref:hypothetical protein n=1 Tax=Nocardia tengchongensis TaxID=2055889 RepID=UPI0033E748AD
MLTKLLDQRLSIRQITYLAIAFGIPYFIIGGFWLSLHHDHLRDRQGLDKAFSAVGQVIAWPPLVISDIDLR